MEKENKKVVIKKNKYDVGDSLKMFFASVFLSQLAMSIISLILMLIANMIGVSSKDFFNYEAVKIITMILPSLVFFVIFLLYNKYYKVEAKESIHFKQKFSPWSILIVILIALICVFSFNDLVNLVDYGIKKLGYKNDFTLPIDLTTTGGFVLGIFFVALLPAIVEELLFRGVVCSGLKNIGKNKMILFSALIFAVIHFNPYQFFYQFILGVVLATVYVFTNNISNSILLHFLNNFIVILVAYITKGKGVEFKITSAWSVILPFVYALIGIGAIILLLFILKKVNNKHREKDELNFLSETNEEEKNEANTKIAMNKQILVLTIIIAVMMYAYVIIEGFI